MIKKEINYEEIERYLSVFGKDKFCGLWNEFLNCSAENWQNMDNIEFAKKRYVFHNWRSGSKIFGMDKFSTLCQRAEDCIINCRTEKAIQLINECRECYTEQITAVKQYLFMMEQENEE